MPWFLMPCGFYHPEMGSEYRRSARPRQRIATHPHEGGQVCHDLGHEFLVAPFGSGQHGSTYCENRALQKCSQDDEHRTLVQHNTVPCEGTAFGTCTCYNLRTAREIMGICQN